MYTRCPHCDTWFRIGAEQLAQAHGQVRCGVCAQQFSALASLNERPEHRRTGPDTKPATDIGTATPISMAASRDTAAARSASGVRDRTRAQTATATDLGEADAVEISPATPPPAPPRDDADLPPLPFDAADGGIAAPWIAAEGGPAAATLRREPSLGPDDRTVMGPISAEGRPPAAPSTPRTRRSSGVATALWGVANLLLIVTLLGQYAYFHRDELAQYPELRPWLVGLCDALGCEVPLQKDASRISLLNRVVQSHPHHEHALLINATLVNDAGFTQPYPVVELRFSDLDNRLVAGRRFRPYEYLPPGSDIKRGMAPREPVRFSLEIADPGKEAVSFQFNLL